MLFYRFTTGTITLERCIGNNRKDDTDYWAVGYEGEFYEAAFNLTPTKFRWTFAEQTTTCTVSVDDSSCTCSGDENTFEVSCSSSPFKTKINLSRKLTSNDSFNQLTIDQEISEGYFGDESGKQISVASIFFICYVTIKNLL